MNMNSSKDLQDKKGLNTRFKQNVLLRPSSVWSRITIWLIVGILASGTAWAYFFNLEQVVSARGQLKPQGKVKEVQIPVNGVNAVVKKVLVKEGDRVKTGDILLVLDNRATLAELNSLKKIHQSLIQENQFYVALMKQPLDPSKFEASIAQLNLPQEIINIARERATLIAENQLLWIEIGEPSQGGNLNAEQLAMLQAAREEADSRTAAAALEISQKQQQLERNRVQLQNARGRRDTAQKIVAEIKPLVEEGAFGRLQYVEKEQDFLTRQAEMEQLLEERQRIEFDLEQAKEELKNTKALGKKGIFQQIATNKKEIATLDSQLNRRIVENKKQIAELNSQMTRLDQTLNYQELRSPTSGIVFDLQAEPGFVPQNGADAIALKIVPDDYLVAEAYVGNKDIGFVREGMEAEIRIEAFPHTEFGELKGKVTLIGSDVLPPDRDYPFYRFPTRVSLTQQTLSVDDRELQLQSGMSVDIKIKVREKRTIFNILTEQFTRQVESIKEIK
jgi:hemolysin D